MIILSCFRIKVCYFNFNHIHSFHTLCKSICVWYVRIKIKTAKSKLTIKYFMLVYFYKMFEYYVSYTFVHLNFESLLFNILTNICCVIFISFLIDTILNTI